jgi:hypothetical protein
MANAASRGCGGPPTCGGFVHGRGPGHGRGRGFNNGGNNVVNTIVWSANFAARRDTLSYSASNILIMLIQEKKRVSRQPLHPMMWTPIGTQTLVPQITSLGS